MGEQRRSPTAMVLWVLSGCVVFVVGGLWLTQLRSDAKEWSSGRDDEWEEEEWDDDEELRTHDTFEDAWKTLWKAGESESSSESDGATDVVRSTKPARRVKEAEKTSTDRSTETPEKQTTQIADGTTEDTVETSPLVGSDAGAELAAVDTVLISNSESSVGGSLTAATSTTVAPPNKVSTGLTTGSALTTTEIVEPARTASPAEDLDKEIAALSQESRVVTLRLSGSVGGKRLDPKDGYAWGRLAYFFQRERKPSYFLVFPGGALSGVMGPPAAQKPGVRRTVQGLPSMRPRGRLGAPLFVINLMATVESAGTMRFYGRGLAQKYVCRVNAQVVYLGDEKPRVVDSFTVTENATAVQGKVATGPPGGAIYQAAIEKLITRLRATTYFR